MFNSRFLLIVCRFTALCAQSPPPYAIDQQPDTSQSWNRRNFMILNSKFDSLNAEMEQWKANRSTGNDVSCVEKAINSQQFQTKINAMDEKLENIEIILKQLLLVSKRREEDEREEDLGEVKRVTGSEKTTSPFPVQSEANLHSTSCNLCAPNPCIYGGRCQPTSGGKDFRCIECPRYRSGVQCENFECEANRQCWKYKHTLYVAFEQETNWTEAKRKCESEGMSMATLKSKASTDFLVERLREMYGSDAHVYWWMGLEYYVGKGKERKGWRWVDGMDLGTYMGENSYFKYNMDPKNYGLLYLHGEDEVFAQGIITFPGYPLCETRDFNH